MARIGTYPNWHPSKWMTDIAPDPYVKAPHIVDEAMHHHKGRRSLAIQAGGHIGIWPAILSDYFEFVVSFEPVLENYIACIHNIKAKNVLMMPCCLSSDLDLVRVNNSQGFGGSANIAAKEKPLNKTFASCCIPICELPQLVRSNIDAIFLDVEGYELEVLNGAADVLAANHPTITVEENNKSLRRRKAGAVAEFLETFDYRQVGRHGDDLIFVADR